MSSEIGQAGPWTPSWMHFPITTSFGAPTAGDPGRPHLAVDFAAPLGTAIEAAGVGVIDKVFGDNQGGNQVMVKYAQGGTGWFAHLNDVIVKEGDKVTPATVIGHSGSSGNSTAPHLHFQLLDKVRQSVDPLTSFNKLVSQNGSFAASGDCPKGWHRGNMGGAGFCLPDGLMFGGGEVAKNVADTVTAFTPNPDVLARNVTGGSGAGVDLSKFGQVNVSVPGFEGVGSFFSSLGTAFRSENLWRAAFIVVGAGAVFLGGRLYLSNPDGVREAA